MAIKLVPELKIVNGPSKNGLQESLFADRHAPVNFTLEDTVAIGSDAKGQAQIVVFVLGLRRYAIGSNIWFIKAQVLSHDSLSLKGLGNTDTLYLLYDSHLRNGELINEWSDNDAKFFTF